MLLCNVKRKTSRVNILSMKSQIGFADPLKAIPSHRIGMPSTKTVCCVIMFPGTCSARTLKSKRADVNQSCRRHASLDDEELITATAGEVSHMTINLCGSTNYRTRGENYKANYHCEIRNKAKRIITSENRNKGGRKSN